MESSFQSIPKLDLACSQLDLALKFYLQGSEYPSVITLAGAAEEVLGKIAEGMGLTSSLKRTLPELVATCKDVWGHKAEERDFAQLRNRTKNELKHSSAPELVADFEREAAQMLERALENYSLCTGSSHPMHMAFEERMLGNWRAKQAAV